MATKLERENGINIAKDTTDLTVELISQDHSSQVTNLEHIAILESRLSINFKILKKHPTSASRLNLDQTWLQNIDQDSIQVPNLNQTSSAKY